MMMAIVLISIWVCAGYLASIYWLEKFGADVYDELKKYSALHHTSIIAAGPLVFVVGLIIFLEDE